MMMVAQHRRGVDVVVHDQPQLPTGFEPHRLDVHALVGEQAADTRQRARTVGQAERQFNSDHSERLSEVRGARCGVRGAGS